MEYIKTFIRSILAGILIGFGGFICLRTNSITGSTILGSFLFSFGLIIICNFNYNLFTGKICYLFENNGKTFLKRLLDMIIILFGNMVGTLVFVGIIKLSIPNNTLNTELLNTLQATVNSKLNYNWYQMIGLGFFCGILIYIAVEGFKKVENPFGKYVILILAIGGFIICGFEHSIANMFYYFLSGNFNIIAFCSLLLCVIGNSIGGVFIPLLHKIINYNKEIKENL